MAEPQVLAALSRKRAEIAGQKEHVQTRLRVLVIDLNNLDASIRIFKLDIDLEEIRPKTLSPRHHASKGEVSWIVLRLLRQSTRPLTSQEIARHVTAEGG